MGNGFGQFNPPSAWVLRDVLWDVLFILFLASAKNESYSDLRGS